MKPTQILAISFLIILVANITLLALQKITPLLFWIIIGICAVGAWIIRKTGKK